MSKPTDSSAPTPIVPAAVPSASPDVEAFIARWSPSSGAERANYQLFLAELCDLLGVPRPDPSVADDAANTYVFDKTVAFRSADGGKDSTGYIDLYRKGAFVCETKQSVEKQKAEKLSLASPSAAKARRKTGTSTRGTPGWDDSMIAARGQAEGYVRALADDNPPFVLVVDIGHSFELYADFSRLGKVYTAFPDARTHRFSLEALREESVRERLKTLWLDPLALDPSRRAAKVTREIAGRIAVLAKRLEAKGHDPEGVAWFLIRCLFTFFSEDVGLVPKGAFTDLLVAMKGSPEQFVPLVGDVWKMMDTGGFSTALRARVKRFNGGIFREHEPLKLDAAEIDLLIEAGKCDWQDVEPAIFGTLLERALDPRERHKLGAHFTPRAYVERLVVPTLVEPVRDDWETARVASLAQANAGKIDKAKAETRKFLDDLGRIRVLDPACGTGNFLYVSMVKLKEIEAEARDWLGQLGETQADLEHMEQTVDPKQFLGIEINPRAIAIAEVVLWIGWLQWHLRAKKSPDSFSEPILHAYGNIECRDALLEYDKKELVRDDHGKPVARWDGITTKKHPVTGEDVPDDKAKVAVERYVNPRKAEWPEADFIVGNPPFLGPARMKATLGEGYAEALRASYPDVSESVDYVMYWWHKSAEILDDGRAQRFGFVTTNSLKQTFSRRVVESFVGKDSSSGNHQRLSIIFAIPDHPWTDSADGAAVRIAMTAAVRGECEGDLLVLQSEADDGEATQRFLQSRGLISAALSIGADVSAATKLTANSGLANRGFCLFGAGFLVSSDRAKDLGVDQAEGLGKHIRPFRNGKDLTQKPRGVMVIDLFGLTEQEVRDRYSATYQHVATMVKPERDQNNRESRRRLWWIFGEPNKQLRIMLCGLCRYVATSETAKHRVFQFLDAAIAPDNMLVVVASSESLVLGVLSSHIHVCWALAAGGRLGVGNDPRYNKSKCFDTFPFPTPTAPQAETIRELGEALDAHRKRQQAAHPGLTITGMYNVLEKLRSGAALSPKEKTIHDEGLVSVLKKIHDDLDAAVFEAYGWPVTLSDEEILERLVALNHERADEEKRGLVRWLRPEFQNRAGVAKQLELAEAEETYEADDDDDDDGSEREEAADAPAQKPARKRKAAKASAPIADPIKHAWPTTLPEQIRLVRRLLRAVSRPVKPAEVGRFFDGAKPARLKEILETLVALGHARKTQTGYRGI
ncbi:MAG: DNA methyltransferase [Planctomycetia bacterium]